MGDDIMFAQALMRTELLDEDTCDICWDDLNGIVLPPDDPAWGGELGQEAHDHCRFMLVPIFEGIDPVLDYTPTDQVPVMVRHQRQLFPAEEAAEKIAVLAAANGGEILKARQITLDDLADVFTNEELLYRIFYEGGG